MHYYSILFLVCSLINSTIQSAAQESPSAPPATSSAKRKLSLVDPANPKPSPTLVARPLVEITSPKYNAGKAKTTLYRLQNLSPHVGHHPLLLPSKLDTVQ